MDLHIAGSPLKCPKKILVFSPFIHKAQPLGKSSKSVLSRTKKAKLTDNSSEAHYFGLAPVKFIYYSSLVFLAILFKYKKINLSLKVLGRHTFGLL